MGLPQPQKRYSPQEYYELERTAEYKSDFYRGEIFAMAGGSPRHSLICSNIIREAGNRLKETPCVAYESNLRLKTKATGLRHYPDAAVYRGPLEFDQEDMNRNTVTNPTTVFEVLSRSTEAYDRGFKALNYRSVESLKAYVLVSQETAHVEIYLRQADNSWLLRDADGLEASLAIPPLGINLPLAEVYARVDFTAADSAPQAFP